jgi:pyruvate dehydrogenase E1 component alpha subunit
MVKIRLFENEISRRWPEQEMRSPPHMCTGQEAIAVGVCASLRAVDQVIGYYRGHGYYLAKGGDPKALMAELYCKQTGSNGGKGGSMLISSPKVGYLGSSAIVAGGIPIATGLAFGNQIQNFKKVVVCFLGDAATEEGVFYESLNFAALKKLPIIYVCENNGYAVTTHIKFRRANPEKISEIPKAFGIPAYKIDGNDVEEVYRITGKAVNLALNGGGPTFIEGVTYRWYLHVGNKLDSTTGLRTQKELETWMKKDPIKRFEKQLLKNKALTLKDITDIKVRIDKLVADAFTYAKASSLPARGELLTNIYA